MRAKKCKWHIESYLPYLAWHNYAEKMTKKGIKQKQCPECKRWLFPDEYGEKPITPCGAAKMEK